VVVVVVVLVILVVLAEAQQVNILLFIQPQLERVVLVANMVHIMAEMQLAMAQVVAVAQKMDKKHLVMEQQEFFTF
jgi:hypothetical protein